MIQLQQKAQILIDTKINKMRFWFKNREYFVHNAVHKKYLIIIFGINSKFDLNCHLGYITSWHIASYVELKTGIIKLEYNNILV